MVVLTPGERRPVLPPDPDLVVLGRPFRLVDLVTILEHPPASADPEVPTAAAPDPDPPPRPGRRVVVPVLLGLAVLLVLAAVLVGASLNLHG